MQSVIPDIERIKIPIRIPVHRKRKFLKILRYFKGIGLSFARTVLINTVEIYWKSFGGRNSIFA